MNALSVSPAAEPAAEASPASGGRDYLTICTVKHPVIATKQLTPDGKGGFLKAHFTFPKHQKFTLCTVEGLAGLEKALRDLAGKSYSFVIRGKPKAGVNLQWCERRIKDSKGHPATIEPKARFWLAVDFDQVRCPASMDPIHDPEAAADLLRGFLPEAFADVACVWQATSGLGVVKDELRFRLWFWLSRALLGREVKAWLDTVACDKSVFEEHQPIYTATPIINPLPGEKIGRDFVPRRIGLLAGLADIVEVPAELPPPAKRGRPSKADSQGNGALGVAVGFEGYLATMGDGPGLRQFYSPIKSALGSYAGTHRAAGLSLARETVKARIREALAAAPKNPGRETSIERYASNDFLDNAIDWFIREQGEQDEIPEYVPEEDRTGPIAEEELPPGVVEKEVGEDGREHIYISEKHKDGRLHQAARMLREQLYMRGTHPTMLVRGEELVKGELVVEGIEIPDKALMLISANAGRVEGALNRRVLFQQFDLRRSKWVEKSCPTNYARLLIEDAVSYGFRNCAGIARVPLILPDGSLVNVSGYHAPSGLVVDLTEPLPVPDAPDEIDAMAACARLLQPFEGYLPCVDRSALLAAVLTAVARPSLPTAPAVLFDGNAPGVGKGKLARTLAVLSTGTLPVVITEGGTAEELEKRLSAVIISGVPAYTLDNVNRRIASSALESALTEEYVTIRVFGTLDQVRTASRAFVTITANNASLRSDLLRRVLTVRIAVGDEHPERRAFPFDPVEVATSERRELLTAAFTILRAWLQFKAGKTAEGRKLGEKRLGSFEAWSQMVAGAVEWLTEKNPIELIEERIDSDPVITDARRAVAALAELSGGEWFAASDILETAQGFGAFGAVRTDGTSTPSPLDIVATAVAAPGGLNAKSFGRWLSKHRDRVLGGFVVQCRVRANEVAAWRIAPHGIEQTRS